MNCHTTHFKLHTGAATIIPNNDSRLLQSVELASFYKRLIITKTDSIKPWTKHSTPSERSMLRNITDMIYRWQRKMRNSGQVSINPFCLVARSAGTKQPRAPLVSDFTLYASNTPTPPRPQSPLISKSPQTPVPAANLGTTSEE